jgi:hypothetical protein
MTICVSVKVPEGLVFACDSAVTLTNTIIQNGQPITQIIQNFNFANKLTQVKDYPIGVMSWGLASLSERTVHSLIMEFENGYPKACENPNYQVNQVVNDLIGFIRTRYDAVYQTPEGQKIPPDSRILGMTIGGFSDKQFFAEQYIYQFPIDSVQQLVRPNRPDGNPDFGANWYGLTDALVRLIAGFDPMGLEVLVQRGVDRPIIEKWLSDGVTQMPLIFNGMPLQDAIDFAEYCVQVVIGRYRFGPGAPLCGGDIDIAVIRPNSFKWSRHKQWAIKD